MRADRTHHTHSILIFVSVLERKVWVLADRGINVRIELPDDGRKSLKI